MAFLGFKNVRIAGIAACVPKTIAKPKSRNPKYSDEEFVKSVGVAEKRVDDSFCTSDLCYEAAEQLICDLGWDKREIDALYFVSQYPDYKLPATSCILQNRLGLSKECYALDISMGCSGWVYGLSEVCGAIQGGIRKALLLVGDARRLHEGELLDPLFGFAGTATALEFQDNAKEVVFQFGTDGSGYDAIIVPEGGARNRFNEHTLDVTLDEDGICRNGLCSRMKGMDVFSFAISTAPKSIKRLAEHESVSLDDVDYLILHQANKKINDTIAKKLHFDEHRILESMSRFGNTSSASIPVSIVTNLSTEVFKQKKTFMACGFGVGLSWGTAYFELADCIISKLVEI